MYPISSVKANVSRLWECDLKLFRRGFPLAVWDAPSVYFGQIKRLSEDFIYSSRLWVCQGIKLQFACIRGISEKGAKNQTLCGPGENDAAQLAGRLQNGLVRLSIPEDSEDHSGHLSADMTNHIHVMQTFGYFLFVIGLKHRITICSRYSYSES